MEEKEFNTFEVREKITEIETKIAELKIKSQKLYITCLSLFGASFIIHNAGNFTLQPVISLIGLLIIFPGMVFGAKSKKLDEIIENLEKEKKELNQQIRDAFNIKDDEETVTVSR